MEQKRALISVYDKKGVVAFAETLVRLGWEILSTGGTAATMRDNGIPVVDVSEVTNFPEILDGRVKTLSPYIFGGLLYRRDEPAHVDAIAQHGIRSVDLVVNTLYPFVETVANPASTKEEIIEKIDIGGPSMIRAAAKNFKDVIIVTDPADYDEVAERLEAGTDDVEFRRNMATKAFAVTAAYDVAIANYFYGEEGETFPPELFLHFSERTELRYGENPHQKAAYYKEDTLEGTLNDATVLQGKQLSFNNLSDASAAIEGLKEFQDRPTALGLKHANACAIASGDDIYEAYVKCYEADSTSIFGGIVALNREVDAKLAEKLSEIFLEVIVAPSYTEEALAVFAKKKNLRILVMPSILHVDEKEWDYRRVLGGILVQEKDHALYEKLEVVTDRAPTEKEMHDLLFAFRATKAIKSNGIVIAKDDRTLGIGLGEVNRIWAINEGIERAAEEAKGAVCASDAFFPFSDCLEALAAAGVTAVIQPGGSIRDKDSIEVANKAGIAMVFTGTRHFKH